jgi:hypothetical protein
VVQSGVIEMVIGDVGVEVCGPNEALSFMSVVDQSPRSSTARVRETAHLSIMISGSFGSCRRDTELRDVHHGRDGAPHPRQEQRHLNRF